MGKSDHICITFEANLYAKVEKLNKPRYAYHKGNYSEMTNKMKLYDWSNDMEGLDTDSAWTVFNDKIDKESEKHIPKSNNKKHRLYIDKNAERKIKKKYHLWKRFQETNSARDHETFKKESNELRTLTRNLRRDFERKLVKNLKKDPKSFWCYANSKLKTRSKISQLDKQDGTTTNNDKEKADVLTPS